MKNILFFIIFIFSQMLCFGYESKTLQGAWAEEYAYKYLINSKQKSKNFTWTTKFDISNGVLYAGRTWMIDDCVVKSDNIIEITISVEGKDKGWYRIVDCVFVDDNTIYLLGDLEGTGIVYGKENLYYRIFGSAKIPIQNATVNDNRVRLRTKSNLKSDTWGFLNKDEKVKIKDKSEEPFEIAGESWYWYKVDAEGYPDGWVYGKYLDIEE